MNNWALKICNGQQAQDLVEDDGLVIVNQNSIVEVKSYGVGEDGFFEIFALTDQIRDVIAMINSSDILMDDGAFVKISGGVVGGGSNQFNATGMGLMVGLSSGKSREEGVMDIDDWAANFPKKRV